MPAVCLLRMAVGTNAKLIERINSPKPGNIFWHIASVASGVTSLREGPVPPVVPVGPVAPVLPWGPVAPVFAAVPGVP